MGVKALSSATPGARRGHCPCPARPGHRRQRQKQGPGVCRLAVGWVVEHRCPHSPQAVRFKVFMEAEVARTEGTKRLWRAQRPAQDTKPSQKIWTWLSVPWREGGGEENGGSVCTAPSPSRGLPPPGACGSWPAFHHLEPSRSSASFWPQLGCVVEARGPGDPRGSGFQDCGFGDGVSRPYPEGLVGGEGRLGWSWTVGGRWAGGVQPLGSHLESSWSPKDL